MAAAFNPNCQTFFLKFTPFHSSLTFKPTIGSQFYSGIKQKDTSFLNFAVFCNLKDQSRKNAEKKIVLAGREKAPSLAEEVEEVKVKSNGGGLVLVMKRFPRRVLTFLSNLPLAIGEMVTIAGLMALGTAIDQGEAPEYYFQKFPEDNPVFGIFTWKWILTPGFDHMYSSPVFLGVLALLAASLMACTYTTQIPMVKVARRWKFLQSGDAIRKQEFSESLSNASV